MVKSRNLWPAALLFAVVSCPAFAQAAPAGSWAVKTPSPAYSFDGTWGASCTDGTCGSNGSNDLRSSYGYIGQVTYTSGKATLAGSYGASILKDSNTETVAFKTENALASGGLYYQATKSLKVVFELNYATTKDKESGAKKNSSFAPAVGMMQIGRAHV